MSEFDLANYVPYLLNRTGTRIADAFTQVARGEGLTLGMWRVLAVLRQTEPLAVGAVADWTSIEISTLSRLLAQMEAKGLVRRRRGMRDNRQVMVDRTAAGQAVTERLLPVARAYETAATAGFTEVETATLKALLRRLFVNLDRLEGTTISRAG